MATTAKTKEVNYTPEQTAAIVAGYTAGETVEALAEKFSKSVRSIVAKLSREKVYVKKEYVSKTGEKPVKKDEHADVIAGVLGLSANDADSLTKANKTALKAIATFIVDSEKRIAELESELECAAVDLQVAIAETEETEETGFGQHD